MLKIAGIHRKPSIGWRTCATILAVCLGGCASNRQGGLGPVIEAEDLARRLNAKDSARLILLDVRDLAPYEQGHLAGAIRVDPAVWKEESLAAGSGLDHRALWLKRIGSVGVTGRDPIVIYDDGRMTEAARIWFVFQHFGVPEAGVLNGGYPALAPLIAEGRVRVSRETASAKPAEFKPFAGDRARIGLVDRQGVRSAVDHGQAQILDVRSREEYTGIDLRKNKRGGHIPNAINIPHAKLLDESGLLKSAEDLAVILDKAGIRRGQPIITHCDGGGRASLAALAAERAGYGPVMNYYLSFGDWAADASCPLVSPGK